ncbi:hypothetical protein M0Q28_00660 [Patescibacteria group bacterium]|jgi:hypothetical protein|nr:hypothetical protein [Patescibacteria group bacterium]
MKLPIWFRALTILLTWGLACGLLFWVVSLRFPIDGTARFSFAFDGQSPWFNPFQPGERVTSPGRQTEGWVGQRVLGDPVYGSARLPGAYDTLDVSLEVKSLRQPIAELGLLRDEASFSFEMNPLWSEALSSGWRHVKLGEREGYVQEGLADSALLTDDYSRLMVWQADLDTPAWSDTPGEWKTFKLSLRGAHDFHVVPASDGHIRMRFTVQDINRSRTAKNQAAFRLTNGEETVWTESLSVSGVSDKLPSVEVEKNIDISGLKPGVYRLSFLADDDFFIRSVSTNAKRWAIGPRLYVGDTVAYADSQALLLNWSTNSHHLAVETFHKEGLQRVALGGSTVELKRTHTSYPLNRLPDQRVGVASLNLERGSLRMVGDGYFSPDPASLFYPSPRRLTADANPAEEGVVAVLTPLVPPERLADGWWRVRTSWKLPASQEPLRIALGLPGIVTRVGAFDIRHAELMYRRPPLSWSEWWRAVRRELASAWRRL